MTFVKTCMKTPIDWQSLIAIIGMLSGVIYGAAKFVDVPKRLTDVETHVEALEAGK